MDMPSLPRRIALAATVGLVIAWGLVQPDVGPWSVPVALGLSLILILTMMRVLATAGDEPLHVKVVVWGGVGVAVLALVLGAM